MKRTDTLIIGGGQAGLATSRCLSERGIDHVVLEKGQVGERWRSERWDSLKLLTPNWQSRLPGWRYRGDDPDGYMTMPQVIGYLEGYARSFGAPIQGGTTVSSVERDGERYRVTTDRGAWSASSVVIATGQCAAPRVPAMASRLADDLIQIVPSSYRNPERLPDGGVLVVGASATGIQLADEIVRSGREVSLAVGRHIRLPRDYRGRDILWWLDRMGVLSETADDVRDLHASRRQPSLQLVGGHDRRSIDLNLLRERGVRLTGRATDADGHTVRFADDLRESTAAAEDKLARLLDRIDRYVEDSGLAAEVGPAERPARVRVGPAPTALDLQASGIRTVLWATGYRRRYPWLKVPVLDARGEIRHRGGVTPSPGLYVIGLQFLRRRNSSFIDGVGKDAFELTEHLAGRLEGRRAHAA